MKIKEAIAYMKKKLGSDYKFDIATSLAEVENDVILVHVGGEVFSLGEFNPNRPINGYKGLNWNIRACRLVKAQLKKRETKVEQLNIKKQEIPLAFEHAKKSLEKHYKGEQNDA